MDTTSGLRLHPTPTTPPHARRPQSASLRIFANGGGTQSTAALVLQAQGILEFDAFVFANTGHDSERPQTLRYLWEVAVPFARANGIRLIHLQRDGDTLYEHMTLPGRRGVFIPAFGENGAPANRICSHDWKVAVCQRWLRQQGATKKNPAVVALGFSTDELERANPNNDRRPYERLVFPLIELGLSRSDCEQVIRSAGLPLPGKSACWFCPWQDIKGFAAMRREDPDEFDRCCSLEDRMNEGRVGRRYYLTRTARPLRLLADQGVQEALFGSECDRSGCFT
jgi:hypothetical protein